jgi:hypothetical protein
MLKAGCHRARPTKLWAKPPRGFQSSCDDDSPHIDHLARFHTRSLPSSSSSGAPEWRGAGRLAAQYKYSGRLYPLHAAAETAIE